MNRTILAIGALIGSVWASPCLAQDTVVSPQTLTSIMNTLASDDLQGRDNQSEGNAEARAFLIDWMTEAGLTPAGDDGGFEQSFPSGVNILAIHYPPGTEGMAPKAMIGAHYDHVSSCRDRPEAASLVCNGSADNAGGVAASLTAMEALMGSAQVPIAIGLWDAEEDGKVGSEYFIAQPSFDISGLNLYLNLDIIGLNLFAGGESLHLILGAETGGPDLMADVDTVIGGLNLDAYRLSYAFGIGRSDMDSFVDGGTNTPVVFFTDGDGTAYHTDADELSYFNFDKATQVAQGACDLALRASVADTYRYDDPVDRDIVPAYEDTSTLLYAIDLALKNRRANDFTQEQTQGLTHYKTTLSVTEARGAKAFHVGNGAQLFEAVLYLLQVSEDLTFIP